MPEHIRFGNNLFERKCSKCKRMQEPQTCETRNVVYRTCNNCRFKAYQRTHPLNTLTDFNHRGYRTVHISDTDSEQDSIRVSNAALLSLSSSAAACTDNYLVEEPEPEPEP